MRPGRALLALLVWLLAAADALADKRVALVIGNSAYVSTRELENPKNDAEDLATALGKPEYNFKVILGIDLKLAEMKDVLARFEREASDADAAMVFFAGHGLQHEGETYVMPIDATLNDEYKVRYEMVSEKELRDALNRSRGMKILILDACRNNPLASQLKASRGGATRGLAPAGKFPGMLVVHSTQPDDVADDGNGRNSPFTAALLKELPVPNIEVTAMMGRVRARVHEQTRKAQLPDLTLSYIGDFYFSRAETDSSAWNRIRESRERADFAKFAGDFPASPLVELAQARMAQIDGQKPALPPLAQPQPPLAVAAVAIPPPPAEPAPPLPVAAPPAAAASPPVAAPAAAPVAVAAAIPVWTPPAVPAPPQLERKQLITLIKRELTRLGCYSGPVDDRWPEQTATKALIAFSLKQRYLRLLADPDAELLANLREAPSRLCRGEGADAPVKPAPRRSTAPSRRHVAVARPAPEAPPAVAAPRKPHPSPRPERIAAPRRARPAPAPARPGGCFNINGQSFC